MKNNYDPKESAELYLADCIYDLYDSIRELTPKEFFTQLRDIADLQLELLKR